jgi:anti-sigma regulatory factor (Ser/Thr protein kinase)
LRDTVQSLTLTATLESLQPALAFIRKGATEANLPEDRAGQVEVIIEELLMNISRYAYPPGIPGDLTIKYRIPAKGELCFEIADRGREFDPLTVNPPDLTLDLGDRPIGGLGLVLIRSYADSLTYRREQGWNRLTFTISAGAIPADR